RHWALRSDASDRRLIKLITIHASKIFARKMVADIRIATVIVVSIYPQLAGSPKKWLCALRDRRV
ncbi:MAG TPA: hypothetical protein VF988_00215, partial [Verrucomicrobiae bacterium]